MTLNDWTQRKTMTFNEYQDAAVATMARDLKPEVHLAVMALGLTGEAGEVADIIKKVVGHGHPETKEVHEKIIKELGDVLWYIAAMCDALGFDLEEAAKLNIEKLGARYPEGFSTERSINRPNG